MRKNTDYFIVQLNENYFGLPNMLVFLALINNNNKTFIFIQVCEKD